MIDYFKERIKTLQLAEQEIEGQRKKFQKLLEYLEDDIKVVVQTSVWESTEQSQRRDACLWLLQGGQDGMSDIIWENSGEVQWDAQREQDS